MAQSQSSPAGSAASSSAASTASAAARKNISGNSPFEPLIGFSRAVRVGNNVYVSGTGPIGCDDHPDAGAQTAKVLEIIGTALTSAGSSLKDVVRTRVYLTNADDWQAVGRVHAQVFGAVLPAATMVVVAKLLNPSWRVEIEAEAVISGS